MHIDASKLYELRHEDMNESKVAMEAGQLTDLFNRFNHLTAEMHRVYLNYITAQSTPNLLTGVKYDADTKNIVIVKNLVHDVFYFQHRNRRRNITKIHQLRRSYRLIQVIRIPQ